MIDIKLIRAEPDKFIQAAKAKNIQVDIPALLETNRELLEAANTLQDIRTRQNAAGKKIAELAGKQKAQAISDLGELKTQAKQLNDLVEQLRPKFDEQMLMVAQPAADEVPIGKDESQNVTIRTEGEIPKFAFGPKDHVTLGEDLDIIDIPRGVKLAGTRNFILKVTCTMMNQAELR